MNCARRSPIVLCWLYSTKIAFARSAIRLELFQWDEREREQKNGLFLLLFLYRIHSKSNSSGSIGSLYPNNFGDMMIFFHSCLAFTWEISQSFSIAYCKILMSNTLAIHKFGQLFGKALSVLLLAAASAAACDSFFGSAYLELYICIGVFNRVTFSSKESERDGERSKKTIFPGFKIIQFYGRYFEAAASAFSLFFSIHIMIRSYFGKCSK